MKTIKTYITTCLLIFAFSNILAQNEIYNNQPKKVTTSELNPKIAHKEVSIDDYYTEVDYKLKLKQDSEVNANNEVDDAEEYAVEEENKKKNKKSGSVAAEFVLEVAVDVFINMAAILVHFWD